MDRRSQLKKAGSSALPVNAAGNIRVCVTKPKTKERRRFRSVGDIYMNSPRCTLEDVEKLSKMTEEDYPKSNRLNGKSSELGPSKKRKYKSTKISDSVVGKKLPTESGEAEIRENHHVKVSSKSNSSTGKEKQPQSTSSSIKLGKEKMCSSTGSIRAGDKQQHIVPLEIIGQTTNPNPVPLSSTSISQIPTTVIRTEGRPIIGKTCLPAASCNIAADSPMSAGKYTNNSNSVVISSIPDQESQQSIVVAGRIIIITSSNEKMQSSVVPTNSINALTGQNATESTGPSSSSSSTGGARKLRLFGFNIDPTTATQTCQVTNTDNGLHNNQIDFMSINGGQDAGGHLPHHTIIAAQPNMINEFGRLSAAASPVPRASACYMPLVAAPTNINDTVGYYNYPLPAAAAAPVLILNHRVFMNGLSSRFVPPGVVAPGNIIIFQCLPAQSFTSHHQLGSFNSQAVTISPTPWNSCVPASSSRPIRPTPRRFLPPPSSS